MADNQEPMTNNGDFTNEETHTHSDREPFVDPQVYERLIDRLKNERQRLERDMKKDYRNARRYVRAHPEEGVGIAVLGGFFVGYLLGRISRD
jgi:ElaB/YqjD/DUF883 family membrane-anchored ribosome-binding protein